MNRIYPVPPRTHTRKYNKKDGFECENGADQAGRNSLVNTQTHTRI